MQIVRRLSVLNEECSAFGGFERDQQDFKIAQRDNASVTPMRTSTVNEKNHCHGSSGSSRSRDKGGQTGRDVDDATAYRLCTDRRKSGRHERGVFPFWSPCNKVCHIRIIAGRAFSINL